MLDACVLSDLGVPKVSVYAGFPSGRKLSYPGLTPSIF